MPGAQIRLAFREEGKWWNAYVARIDTMSGALRLGGVRFALVQASPLARQTFMEAMKVMFTEHCRLSGVATPPTEFETRPAPEHEKAGHA